MRKELILRLIVQLEGAKVTAEKLAAQASDPIEQGDYTTTVDVVNQEIAFARNDLAAFDRAAQTAA